MAKKLKGSACGDEESKLVSVFKHTILRKGRTEIHEEDIEDLMYFSEVQSNCAGRALIKLVKCVYVKNLTHSQKYVHISILQLVECHLTISQ